MSSESLSTSADNFFRIAEELVMLTKDEALIIAEAVKTSGLSPDQVALQKGLLSAAQVDIIETLLHPRDTIPGYEILDLLGQGGMGVVYRAQQLNLNRIVALKTILLSRMTDKSAAGRFEQEARTVGKLRHPNIVAAYDFGRHEGRLFLAMELVEGEDLESLLRDEGRLDEPTAWGLARQSAAALAHADRLGVVHRDIKPANLLLVEPPEGFPLPDNLPMVKIADFGLAFLSDEQQAHTRLTSDNSAVGSPHYMAPEQLTDSEVDFRADIYALGATVYHMLAGRPPFGGLNLSQIIAQKLSGDMKPLSVRCPDISAASCELVQRMLARHPEERPSDYRTLLAEIERVAAVTEKTSVMGRVAPSSDSGSEGRLTDIVSRQETQIVNKTADAAQTSAIAAVSSPQRPSRRRLRQLAVTIGLFAAVGMAVWAVRSAQSVDVLPVPMDRNGADYPLFYGTGTTDWRNNYGNWVAAEDNEHALVLAGTNGEIIRYLPLKRDSDGRGILFPYYRLTLVVDPHDADAVEIRFGIQPGGRGGTDELQPDQPNYVLRMNADTATLGERFGTRGEFRSIVDTVSLPKNPQGHSLQIECQPNGWFVSVNRHELAGLPRRTPGELPEFRLMAEGGPAWFSNIFIVELTPRAADSNEPASLQE